MYPLLQYQTGYFHCPRNSPRAPFIHPFPQSLVFTDLLTVSIFFSFLAMSFPRIFSQSVAFLLILLALSLTMVVVSYCWGVIRPIIWKKCQKQNLPKKTWRTNWPNGRIHESAASRLATRKVLQGVNKMEGSYRARGLLRKKVGLFLDQEPYLGGREWPGCLPCRLPLLSTGDGRDLVTDSLIGVA